MASLPPPGSASGPVDRSGPESASLQAFTPIRHSRQAPASSDWPPVLLWLPISLSSLVLVLLVVVVQRQHAQAQLLADLRGRVQTLEQSRALERTAVLEQQLRAMLTRLQTLERGQLQGTELARRLQSLQSDLQELRAAVSRSTSLQPLPLEPPQDSPRPSRFITPRPVP
jgi:hypothetical protein